MILKVGALVGTGNWNEITQEFSISLVLSPTIFPIPGVAADELRKDITILHRKFGIIKPSRYRGARAMPQLSNVGAHKEHLRGASAAVLPKSPTKLSAQHSARSQSVFARPSPLSKTCWEKCGRL